jgi:hypothetical protein
VIEPPFSESEHAAQQWLHDLGELLAEPSNVILLRDAHLLGHRLLRPLTHLLEHLDRATTGQLISPHHPSTAGSSCEGTDRAARTPAPRRHSYCFSKALGRRTSGRSSPSFVVLCCDSPAEPLQWRTSRQSAECPRTMS